MGAREAQAERNIRCTGLNSTRWKEEITAKKTAFAIDMVAINTLLKTYIDTVIVAERLEMLSRLLHGY
jgi:IS5 family transposase